MARRPRRVSKLDEANGVTAYAKSAIKRRKQRAKHREFQGGHAHASTQKRGGARPGAGRPKGSVAKIDKIAREQAAASGELPLSFMLRIMRDEEQPIERRMAMAVSAAPFCHAKYTAVAFTNDQTKYDAMVRKIERVIIDHDPKKFEATFSDITDVETEESRKLASTVGADTAASRAAAIAGNNHTPHPANAAD